jgi:phosphoenolpyruvate carboxylase
MSTPAKKKTKAGKKRPGIYFAEKDEALRNDVRELGKMVGELLVEQGGEALYKTVESARRYAIARREGDTVASDKLESLLANMSPTSARDVVRAFSTYFQVVNTAEQVHRIRRRRDYLKDSSKRQQRSFDSTFFQLKESGYGPEAVEELLSQLAIQPVFTAHPTETTRRTILRKQQNIVRRMVDVQNPALTPQESLACFESIRADVTAIWQTEDSLPEGQTIADELEHTLFFMTDVIYRVIPPFYEAIEASLQEIYADKSLQLKIPNLLHFGSLIVGDLSTNPEISARSIRDTLARQRTLLLDLYFKDCRQLGEKLSQSNARVEVDEALIVQTEKYARQFPGVHSSIPHRHRSMPYRVFIRLITERLQATFDDAAFPYENAQQFTDDLKIVATSLANRRGANAGLFAVKRIIRRVETFGFHFMSLDIRHNAHELQRVVGFCLDEDNWFSQSSSQRAARLSRALEINDSPAVEPDNDAKRLFAIFRAIPYCRNKYGDAAIGALLVRHCGGVDDVLAALLIARWADIHSLDGTIPLDITPSFENATELKDSSRLVQELMDNPFYRRNLEARDSHQTVMLSISDATADGSVAASRWNMQRAHTELSQLFDTTGVDYTFFHGRGSLSGRGGVADGIAHGHLRATEHGEAVNERYGVRGIAVRTLEKAFSAVTMATANVTPNRATDDLWPAIMDVISASGDEVYAELTGAGFDEYFKLVTPIDVLDYLQSGGRVAEDEPVYAHRNTPWTFAWAQSRFLLPAWYGFGTGIQQAVETFGIDKLQYMLGQWPFFGRLVADVEIALSVADLGIAEYYSRLAGEELHARFFPAICTEHELCVSTLLSLTNQEVLLESNNTLRRSIRLRNPYVDPMSLMQVSLLERWRKTDRANDKLLRALRASVNGISRGLHTTG